MKPVVLLTALIACFFCYSCTSGPGEDLPPPNILWIVAEDIGPYLGCYGDENAHTPNLDQLAAEGVLYRNAFANAPVCAPARSTIITGMYPPGMGTQHMRSRNKIPEFIRLFPGYLKDAGYYCTNNRKKDYNLVERVEEWHESSGQAHYRDRAPGQPFFAIFNFGVCHESCIHSWDSNLVHEPEEMVVPPYHPDLPEIRHDWAQFYDRISRMDTLAGQLLQELEENGLKDSTIIFFYGDHGGILGRSKRFMFETGLNVPMIVRVPDTYKHLMPGRPGTETDRMVAFIDLAPTVLNLAGVDPPDYMQGNAFVGPGTGEENPYVYTFRGRMDERYDFSRGTFSKDFHYVINYMPYRKYAQRVSYLWRAPSMRAWEQAYLAGDCNEVQSRFFRTKPVEELYDRHADPWEVNNLAGDDEYAGVLEELRTATQSWQAEIRDVGFVPEGIMRRIDEKGLIWEYNHSDEYPIDEIINTAYYAVSDDAAAMCDLKQMITGDHPALRYWGAVGGIMRQDRAKVMLEALQKGLSDSEPEVRLAAAEAMYRMGHHSSALPVFREDLFHETPETVLFAVNIIQSLGPEAIDAMNEQLQTVLDENENRYVQRAVQFALTGE